MSDLMTAADNVRRFAKQFEGILAVADVLEQLGKLDQVILAKNVEAAETIARADAAATEFAEVKKDTASLLADAEIALTSARSRTEAIAADIKRAAEEDAAGILKAAQDSAAASLADAASNKAKLSSELEGLEKAIANAQADLVLVLAEKDEADKALATTQKKFDDLQTKLRALVA